MSSLWDDNSAIEMREELFNKMSQHIIMQNEEIQSLRDRLDAKEYLLQEAITTIRHDKMAMDVKNV